MNENHEPSVLDYVKSLLMPWKGQKVELPPLPASQPPDKKADVDAQIFASLDATTTNPPEPAVSSSLPTASQLAPAPIVPGSAARSSLFSLISSLPWRSLLALWIGLFAQVVLQPRPDPERWKAGLFFYLVAFAFLVWASFKGEWSLPALIKRPVQTDPNTARLVPLVIAIILAPIAFLAFGGNMLTTLNMLLWLVCIAGTLYAFWVRGTAKTALVDRWNHLVQAVKAPEWRLAITRWGLLLLVVFAVAVFYRSYHLSQVPPEMNSDHAEKLMDVYDVLHGQYHIYFPRNTGREGLIFYAIALTSQLLGTGISFISMKITTVVAGLITLPYIYLLAKEYGGRQAAIIALLLAGVAAWPNILARLSLRISFYPLFTAPVLYHLIRGLRTGSRNQFILSGIFLGLGLHGYTPMRIVPLVVLVAVGLYLLHTRNANQRKQALLGLGVLIVVSFVIFLPLLRYAQENPHLFAYRAFTRLMDWERPLPSTIGSLAVVFIKNVWNAFIMMGWDSGEIWLLTAPHRPALDIVSAALFYLGFAGLLVTYLRTRRWEYLFLALCVPLLQLPSSLSLAFPAENPAPSRMEAAMVPVFVIAGLAYSTFLKSIYKKTGELSTGRHTLPVVMTVLLLPVVFSQNYDLVFKYYYDSYAASSWNTSEIGQIIHDYIDTIGEPDTAWVVVVPYWVDTRLPGFVAGQPTRDYAIFPENIPTVAASDTRTKLFILRPDDTQDLKTLQQLYPQNITKEYQSKYENKNLILFLATGPSTNSPAAASTAGGANP